MVFDFVMTEKISKEAALGEVVTKFPAAVPVMLKHGLHCVGCHVAASETVEQGAKAHGMTDQQVDELLKEMNKAVKGEKKGE